MARKRKKIKIRECHNQREHFEQSLKNGIKPNERYFECSDCGVKVCMWCEGGSDDNRCDDCWVEEHPEDCPDCAGPIPG